MWSNIHLGDDVYLECDIQANPAIYNVTWRHNVSIKTVWSKGDTCDGKPDAHKAFQNNDLRIVQPCVVQN